MTSHGSIDRLAARAVTPDEQAFAEIAGRTDVTLSLAPGYWHRASVADLEWQLSRLARLLFAARTKAYHQIRSEDFGEPYTAEPPMIGRRDESYARARAELAVHGEATDGMIRVSAVGMQSFTVELDPRVKDMGEDAFCAAVSQAATELVRAQFAEIKELKRTIYADEPV